MNNELKKICPVCGYDKLELTPYDEHGYPLYEICSCCGFEYGHTDSHDGKTFEEYRQEWIQKGFQFHFKKDKPKVWDETAMKEQLNNTNLVNYKPRIIKR